MISKIISPSLKDVQYLYSKYSTIENKNILYNALADTLAPSFLSRLDYCNIHDAYNQVILRYYPNEICVKSNFIKKVLMKGQNHVTIFELPIGSSRADLCKINGTSIAYEIKTDLDNFSRLNKQLNDYSKVFDEVYVICSENNLPDITRILPTNCGIYAYTITNRGTYHFKLVKDASRSLTVDPQKQLRLLRRREYYDYFDLPNQSDREAKSIIIEYIMKKYDYKSINKIFKHILKDRYQKHWDFLKCNHGKIYEIDYQWFFKNQVEPEKIYR